MTDSRTALNLTSASGALWPVLGAVLVTSVVTDLLWRRIPDWVTWPALAVCLGLRFLSAGGGDLEHGLLSGLIGAAGLSALFAVMALRQKMGWGDVKLTAVVGAGLGYPAVLGAAAFISLAGALQALVALLWRGTLWQTLSGTVRRWLKRGGEQDAQGVPYAVAVALGTLWTFFWEHSNLK